MLRWLLNRTFVRMLPSRVVKGLRVVVSDSSTSLEEARKRIEAALGQLARCDRRRFLAVTARLRYVHVWAGHYTASTVDGGMLLSVPDLVESDESELAGLLVHEMVHVRLRAARVLHNAGRMERIERRCLVEQLDSLRRMGWTDLSPEDLVESILEEKWWTKPERLEDLERLVHERSLPSAVSRFVSWREALRSEPQGASIEEADRGPV